MGLHNIIDAGILKPSKDQRIRRNMTRDLSFSYPRIKLLFSCQKERSRASHHQSQLLKLHPSNEVFCQEDYEDHGNPSQVLQGFQDQVEERLRQPATTLQGIEIPGVHYSIIFSGENISDTTRHDPNNNEDTAILAA